MRPRRSCLYMPGSNSRALEKATQLPADVLILDLEDAVLPDAKSLARDQVADTVVSKPFGNREVVVRINGLETPWGEADLAQTVEAGPDGILLPKVESAEQVQAIDAALNVAGAEDELGLWVMIETPMGVVNVGEIAAAARGSRLSALVIGTNDLAKDMRVTPTADRRAFQYALSATVTAGRAYGLSTLDGVCNAIGEEEVLEAQCQQGRELGFDGKTLIHPSQLAAANRIFAPDPVALGEARAIIEAFALPENVHKGVIVVGGRMVERLHLEEAEQLVALNDAIEALAVH